MLRHTEYEALMSDGIASCGELVALGMPELRVRFGDRAVSLLAACSALPVLGGEPAAKAPAGALAGVHTSTILIELLNATRPPVPTRACAHVTHRHRHLFRYLCHRTRRPSFRASRAP